MKRNLLGALSADTLLALSLAAAAEPMAEAASQPVFRDPRRDKETPHQREIRLWNEAVDRRKAEKRARRRGW